MYGPGSRRRLPDSAFERGAAEGPPGWRVRTGARPVRHGQARGAAAKL